MGRLAAACSGVRQKPPPSSLRIAVKRILCPTPTPAIAIFTSLTGFSSFSMVNFRPRKRNENLRLNTP